MRASSDGVERGWMNKPTAHLQQLCCRGPQFPYMLTLCLSFFLRMIQTRNITCRKMGQFMNSPAMYVMIV